MPGSGAAEPESVKPDKNDQFHQITNVSHPTLAVFRAPKQVAPAPAMIICPGGGYQILSYKFEGTEIAAWLNSAGISALVLKYRVPNNREGALQDIQRALSLARARAAEWNIDPARLGVIGFSAGGNLAVKASTQFNRRTYPAIDAADQQSCRPDFAVLVYPAYLDKDGKLAPDINLTKKVPPTLILHCEDDTKYVTGSKVYHAALDEMKVPNDFILYHTGGHGWGLHCKRDAGAWPQAALEWLHKIGIQ